jgi:hypothetical protein
MEDVDCAHLVCSPQFPGECDLEATFAFADHFQVLSSRRVGTFRRPTSKGRVDRSETFMGLRKTVKFCWCQDNGLAKTDATIMSVC